MEDNRRFIRVLKQQLVENTEQRKQNNKGDNTGGYDDSYSELLNRQQSDATICLEHREAPNKAEMPRRLFPE
jgi:hypothetical protein